MDKVGGEEEGEMYGQSNIEIYNTMCKTDREWEFLLLSPYISPSSSSPPTLSIGLFSMSVSPLLP